MVFTSEGDGQDERIVAYNGFVPRGGRLRDWLLRRGYSESAIRDRLIGHGRHAVLSCEWRPLPLTAHDAAVYGDELALAAD